MTKDGTFFVAGISMPGIWPPKLFGSSTSPWTRAANRAWSRSRWIFSICRECNACASLMQRRNSLVALVIWAQSVFNRSSGTFDSANTAMEKQIIFNKKKTLNKIGIYFVTMSRGSLAMRPVPRWSTANWFRLWSQCIVRFRCPLRFVSSFSFERSSLHWFDCVFDVCTVWIVSPVPMQLFFFLFVYV